MRRLSFIIVFLSAVNYLLAQSPHTDALKLDCSMCHNPDNWEVKPGKIAFDHSKTEFELVGQHKSVNCRSCHSSLVFSEASVECFSCHKDIHQNTVGNDCAKCHTPETWIVKDIVQIHELSRFPLVGVHLRTDCIQCHSGYTNLYFEPLDISCYSCHASAYNATTSPNHSVAGFSTECEDCHSINSDRWSAGNFNHDFFPLTGGHKIENCFSCHRQGSNFSGLSNECYSCHKKDYEGVQDPNHLAGNYPTDCTLCHNINNWTTSNFNHDLTAFPLTGAHLKTDCSMCHQQKFTGTPTNCVACHQESYNAALNPNHQSAGISTECQSCHTTTAWVPSSFSHSATGFQLAGLHAAVQCSSCHKGTTTGLSQECVSCHQQDYNTSTNPSHTALSIPTDCQTCHTPSVDWKPASFTIHNNYYPIVGAHTTVDCNTCHNDNYTTTPNTCYGCHSDKYNSTTNPSHAAAGFSTDCQSCHTQTAWTPATFDHDNQFFPIYSGSHRGKWDACSNCHTNSSNYSVFSCITCHEHNQADMNNEHQGISGYSYDSQLCYSCHPRGEGEGAFNHALSNFPLTGAHTTVSCSQCHTSGYAGTTTVCYECHRSNYSSTTNPNHQALSISTDCNTCHTTNAGWRPAAFAVHNNYYAIAGAHTALDCNSCHNGNYTNTPNTCYGCHQSTYSATNNPNHQSIGISTDCQSCHIQTAWVPSSFSHSATGFQLVGQHATVQCSSCHKGTTTGLSQECVSCHQQDYNTSTNPSHTALSLPTDCQSCHTPSVDWKPATFTIHNNYYPIVGAHTTVDCNTCHNGNYTTTPNTCYGCHSDKYNSTTNPSHASAGFSTDCQSCHTQTAWTPATFDHDNQFFPIYSGSHRGKWDACSNCHTNSSNYSVFSCITCHEHNQTDMNDEHHEVSGYVYNSNACYDCHPRGSGDIRARNFRRIDR